MAGPGGVSPSQLSVIQPGPSYGRITRLAYAGELLQAFACDEPAGTTARDAAGAGRDGAYLGSPALGAAGIETGGRSANLGAAAEIDGYSAGLAAAFNPDEGSLGLWAAPDNAGAWTDANTYCLAFVGASATYYNQVRKNGSDLLISAINRMGASIPTCSTPGPRTARWLHVLMTWSRAANQAALYINGTKQRPANGLGTWSGSLAASSVRYGDTSTLVGSLNWPGRVAHTLLSGAAASPARAWVTARPARAWVTARPRGQVIIDGDSRSNLKNWYNLALEAAFPAGDFCYGRRGLASWATSGQTVEAAAGDAAGEIDPLLRPGNNLLVMWAGVNDAAAGSDATTIHERLAGYCSARRAAGWRVAVCSEIDAQTAGLNAAGYHATIWPGLNALVRANWEGYADALIDLGADARLQDATDLAYFNADRLHLSEAGYAVVAETAAPVLARWA